MIRFKNVTKEYTEKRPVVSDLDLEINAGEFFVIIGPSGSGKTTTLKMINRLIPLTSGHIYVNEKPINESNLQELRWNIGYVLQQIALFPNMTVEENILVVPEMKKWPAEKMQARVTELLSSVGLDPESYRARNVSELSGGEQQRVGVVRALAADPDIILMDEPFSALDPISKKNLQQDVAKLQRKLKKTIVFVTHDMQEALTLGDRVCLMNHGKVVQIGTPDEIRRAPENDFVRDFLISGNIDIHGSRTIQSVIESGHCREIAEEDKHTLFLKPGDSVESLIIALAAESAVRIKEAKNGKTVEITKQHLLTYLAEDIRSGGEER